MARTFLPRMSSGPRGEVRVAYGAIVCAWEGLVRTNHGEELHYSLNAEKTWKNKLLHFDSQVTGLDAYRANGEFSAIEQRWKSRMSVNPVNGPAIPG